MGSSLRLSFVLGKTGWQILSGYLRFLLSFSLCLVGRSADHQPNARSAQTGEADKLMGRFADHSLTGWDALRTITSLSSLIFALLAWWGARRTINQTREAHNPAKPTNSWGALRTMIQLGGTLCGPSHRSLLSFSLCLMGRSADHDPTGWSLVCRALSS